MSKIFISHSSRDVKIVELFIDVLIKAFKIDEEDIVCSSLDGHKFKTGSNWIESIKDNIDKSMITFLLLSKNYIESQICMIECGAILQSKGSTVLILKSYPNFNEVNHILKSIQFEEIGNEESLNRIKDILLEKLQLKTPKSDFWSRLQKAFIFSLSELQKSNKPSDIVENKFERANKNDYIVDAVISHDDNVSNIDLFKKLTNELKINNDRSIDLKYNYLGSIPASNWINLSQNPSYGHSKIIQAIRDNIGEIISHLNLQNGQKIDFISLGAGDGIIDKHIIHELLKFDFLNVFYPFDISFDLLQKVVNEVINNAWWDIDKVKIKAIHGDFSNLVNYKSVYDFDKCPNFFSVLGYTFGNYNESEFIGKIKEGMNNDDFLLLDARLHSLDNINDKLSNEDKDILIAGYNNESTYKFAFSALETVTNLDYGNTEFTSIAKKDVTVVPNAINILIECRNINTRFRIDNRVFRKNKICLGSSTLYSFEDLSSWLSTRGFKLLWSKKTTQTGFYLLQKK